MSHEDMVVETLNGIERDSIYGSQLSSTATGVLSAVVVCTHQHVVSVNKVEGV